MIMPEETIGTFCDKCRQVLCICKKTKTSMKHSTILVPVKCSDRNPEIDEVKRFETDQGWIWYWPGTNKWFDTHGEPMNPIWWREEQHDKIVLSEEEFIILTDKNCPNTVEEARAYLIKEGLDPDELVKEGLKFIEELKAKIKNGK